MADAHFPAAKAKTETRAEDSGKEGSEKQADPRPYYPDGGWGWMVVFGSFMIHVIADGIAYSFGVYVEELKSHFDCSSAEIGMLGSLMIGITWGTGPIASIFTNKYGCRAVTIAGTLVAAVGFLLSIAAPNIIFMYISFGVIAGFGLGLAYLPAIIAVSFYFEKRRSLATGLAVCGSGFGTFLFAPLTNLLLEEYAWKGTVLIETGLLLNCILCGAVFRPLELTNKPVSKVAITQDSTELPLSELDGKSSTAESSRMSDMSRLASSLSSIPHHKSKSVADNKIRRRTFSETDKCANGSGEMLRPSSRKDIFYPASLEHIPMFRSNPEEYKKSMTLAVRPSIKEEEDEKEEEDSSCVSRLCNCFRSFTAELGETMDITLLWDFVFVLFAVSNLLTSIGYVVPYVFLPIRATTMEIADPRQASFLLSIIGITNTIGRIVFGYIADFKFVNRLMLYNTVLVLCGLASFVSSLCVTYPLMAAYAGVFGFMIGVYTCLTPIVLVDLLGLKKLSNSFGLVLLFQGIGAVSGPPIAGAIYESTKSYDDSFYLMGACILFSGLMLYPVPCIRRAFSKAPTEEEIALGKAPTTSGNAQLEEERALQQSTSNSVV